jgi:hypothetical protein
MVIMEMNLMLKEWEYINESFDTRHGGPFDRGSADSYYGRPRDPHYFKGGTHNSEKVTLEQMSFAEILAYNTGYDYNEQYGDKKDWG